MPHLPIDFRVMEDKMKVCRPKRGELRGGVAYRPLSTGFPSNATFPNRKENPPREIEAILERGMR